MRPGDPDTHVAKRLYWMRRGRAHTLRRLFPNGRVVELIGNPMPGGGFVMSFSDITAYREAERALKGDANEGSSSASASAPVSCRSSTVH